MRTTVELDDDLLAEAAKYSAATSKKKLIHEALAVFVAVKSAERQRATYRERLAKAREMLAGVRLGVDTRDLIRSDRDSR